MKYIQTFESFVGDLNEKTFKPYVSPEIVIAKGIAAQNQKIADLKKEMMDKPEQKDFILAKIQVELEKIDSFHAQKNLLAAKDFEEQRKAREKAQKARDKAKPKKD